MTAHGNSLAGKAAVITGASRGLGADIARALWRNRSNLLLVARSQDGLIKLREELIADAEDGQELHIVVADLMAADAVPAIIREARQVWDRIDVLINNAAILGPIGRVWENDWQEWQTTVRVNLLSSIELCRACIPWMAERKYGKIINLSGGGATGPRPNFSAYATAKAGLIRFSETLAMEVRDLNIDVNCVAPGMMNTAMTRAVLNAGPEKAGATEYTQATSKSESARPDTHRAADLCVFLASTASDGITGKLISAVWDPWETLPDHIEDLKDADIYTLRRIVPKDRGQDWG
ncbi:Short-chain alcohol dehydrogenase [Candidatus Methylomirabilis oxygeniifera]|uniref:Short-chain alcohol dehydrogenase n=1 Tax=Methylomirabilis oxygeniifera TaxID=671143 RepID=D5MMA9_METO1|nr:Short-chain alcohol dehydrogenase [Candidatus Methylomirabilis oxyfera]